jgi:hypothetical protein
MIAMNPNDTSLERDRLRVVIATIVINIVAVSLLTFAPWSDWRTGAALNIVDNCLLVGFVLVRRDELLARFLFFGLVVGFTELAADAWLVDYTHTLDYSHSGNIRVSSRLRCCAPTSTHGLANTPTLRKNLITSFRSILGQLRSRER